MTLEEEFQLEREIVYIKADMLMAKKEHKWLEYFRLKRKIKKKRRILQKKKKLEKDGVTI